MAFSGRTPTKKEKAWMNSVSQCGCIVCIIFHNKSLYEVECSPHHIDGKTKPGAHLRTIGLCQWHHQTPPAPGDTRWVSRHGNGRAAFEARYATEDDLLKMQASIIEKHKRISSNINQPMVDNSDFV